MYNQKRFSDAVTIFKNSNQFANDYMSLIITTVAVTQGKDPLYWVEVREILEAVVGKGE